MQRGGELQRLKQNKDTGRRRLVEISGMMAFSFLRILSITNPFHGIMYTPSLKTLAFALASVTALLARPVHSQHSDVVCPYLESKRFIIL